MHRARVVLAAALAVLLGGASSAQALADGIAAAQQQIEAQNWDAALDLLLGAQGEVGAEGEALQVAALLDEVAAALRSSLSFERELLARRAALTRRQQIHGETDDADLVANLTDLAICLRGMGRTAEALPHYEAAFAMSTRLHGDEDHDDVATSENNLGFCLDHLGRAEAALPHYEAALAMRRRLHGEQDHADVMQSLGNVASCLVDLGRPLEALPLFEAGLAMSRRVYDGRDHAHVATSLNNLAFCLQHLGRSAAAATAHEEALAMRQRVYGDRDHPDVATSHNNLAVCQRAIGRVDQAMEHATAALEMRRRIHGDRDHPAVARSMNVLASCLVDLGRLADALPLYEAALAMGRRLSPGRGHPDLVQGLNSVASCLESLGRYGDALPRHEAALAMCRDLCGGRDHPAVARSLDNLGSCLAHLGRASEALPQHESALAMLQRVYDGSDHPFVANSLAHTAICLELLGRRDEALPRYEAALAMSTRLHGEHDHVDIARALHNVAACEQGMGRAAAALPRFEQALAMWLRLFGDGDHDLVATGRNNLGTCLAELGRPREALEQFTAALAMRRRLYGVGDHPLAAQCLDNMSGCLQQLDEPDQAMLLCRQAVDMIERLRQHSGTSASLQQSMFDELKRWGAFERLQELAVQSGDATAAFQAAERSRGRELLDRLEQRFDPLEEAERRAAQAGAEAQAHRLGALRAGLAAASLEVDRLLHRLSQLDVGDAPAPGVETQRRDLLAASDEAGRRRRQLLDERARVLGDELPIGRVRAAAEIQAVLAADELLLEFILTGRASFLYVLGHEGDVEALPLPDAAATAQRVLPALLQRSARLPAAGTRGRDPEAPPGEAADVAASRELFASIVPRCLWPRLQAAKRVFVAAHRALHRLPFELLVTDVHDGRPVYWLDAGPQVAYVPSGSVLHWLRTRGVAADDAGGELGLLAIGDPRQATSGLQQAPVRSGDLERLRRLPPLRGARAEARAIDELFAGRDEKTRCLLGTDATEPAVFELAAKARYLHFACHGIAEEYAGRSLSMLVLSQPQQVVPGDDGMLDLDDLFTQWRGRLVHARLAVLSACRTNVGPTQRDDAPQALPLGFLFAGVPAVISSLWAVDDESTRLLMTDFYQRLLTGETDRLAAFTAARQALRAKYPDPFHWAAFLFLGRPD